MWSEQNSRGGKEEESYRKEMGNAARAAASTDCPVLMCVDVGC